jgi:hypothetical protein
VLQCRSAICTRSRLSVAIAEVGHTPSLAMRPTFAPTYDKVAVDASKTTPNDEPSLAVSGELTRQMTKVEVPEMDSLWITCGVTTTDGKSKDTLTSGA